MAGQIYFDPTPSTTATVVIEYYTDLWCESSGGTDQRLWASDTDLPILPDDCFILGLMWRFRRSKGLDYQEEYNAYEELVARQLGRTGMAPILDIAATGRGDVRLLDECNIPDTGFGV
jgi:hypothetical protein